MSKKTKSTPQPVNVKNIIYEEEEDYLGTNQLTFILTGPEVNYVFSNTIVRVIESLVGSYAFHPSNIIFQKDTSIFNPDAMKLRISNMNIIFKDYQFETIDNFAETCVALEEQYDSIDKPLNELELLEKEKSKHLALMNNIHMYVDANNTEYDLLNVTSSSKYVTFYKDNKIIPDIYPREIQIVQLHPGKEINFVAKSDFNIPVFHNIYSSAHKVAHSYADDETTFKFLIKSNRQIPEQRIVLEACNIIILKLEKVRNKLKDKVNEIKTMESTVEITIENENHTMGGIVTRGFQDHEYTRSAGYKMPHPDEKKIILQLNIEGMSIKKVIDNVIDKLIANYTLVRNAFL